MKLLVRLCVLSVFSSAIFVRDLSAQSGQDNGNTALAKFSDGKLTVAEFARRQPALLSWAGIGANADQVQQAVEDMVLEGVVAKEAKESGLAQKPEVQDQINRILKTAYLKDQVSFDEIEVSDLEIEGYYKKNLDQFKKPEIIKYSHILFPNLNAAQNGRKELGAGSWDKLALQSLDSLSGKRRGSFGAVAPTLFTSDLRSAATEITPGSLSEPVKTVFGYHILKLDKSAETTYYDLEDVRKNIYDELMRQKRRERLGSVQKKLWGKYDVEIDKKAIEDLVKQYAEQNVNVDRSSAGRGRDVLNKKTDLQVITELIDLGNTESKEVTESILVANNSDHVVEIKKVGSSCPCVQASMAETSLKPGQVTKLNFVYNPNVLKDGGNVERMVFIESDDSIEPKKYIRIRANVRRSAGAAAKKT